MMTKILSGCVLAALTLMVAPDAWAQRTAADTDRRGTAGSAYLLLPLTARTAGVGATVTGGLAGMSGVEAAYTNPAGLTNNTGTNVLFSRMEYVADIGLNYFGFGQRFGNNQIGLSVAAWDFGEIPLQTEEEPEVSQQVFTADFVTAGITYARTFTDRIAAGITVKVVSESIDNAQASGVAFDAGMNYTVGESGLKFGVSLKNFGTSLSYAGDGLVRTGTVEGETQNRTFRIGAEDFELPSLLNFGVTYSTEFAEGAVVSVLGNFRSNSFENDEFAVGLEAGLRQILYVRGGYSWQEDLNDNFFEGWNVGGGLNLDVEGLQLAFDYAYRGTEVFDNVQIFTVSVVL